MTYTEKKNWSEGNIKGVKSEVSGDEPTAGHGLYGPVGWSLLCVASSSSYGKSEHPSDHSELIKLLLIVFSYTHNSGLRHSS